VLLMLERFGSPDPLRKAGRRRLVGICSSRVNSAWPSRTRMCAASWPSSRAPGPRTASSWTTGRRTSTAPAGPGSARNTGAAPAPDGPETATWCARHRPGPVPPHAGQPPER
jgi:hypothetical protein